MIIGLLGFKPIILYCVYLVVEIVGSQKLSYIGIHLPAFVIKNSILNELKLLKKRNQTSIVKKDLKIS